VIGGWAGFVMASEILQPARNRLLSVPNGNPQSFAASVIVYSVLPIAIAI
jgi:hypothetical protein